MLLVATCCVNCHCGTVCIVIIIVYSSYTLESMGQLHIELIKIILIQKLQKYIGIKNNISTLSVCDLSGLYTLFTALKWATHI